MSILDKIIKKDDDEKKKNVVNEKDVDKNKKDIKTENTKKGAVKKNKKISKDKIPLHYFDIIKKPHISEKTFNLSQNNQYVFVVSPKANKTEIKKAIKSIYGVSVVSVNIINIPSKPKRFKGKPGIKSGYSKAIVKLKKGNSIDLMKENK